MLILQRKAGQSLLIDGKTKVTVVEINGDRVKIAIDAPKDIPIIRTELIDAADSNREASSAGNDNPLNILKNMLGKKE